MSQAANILLYPVIIYDKVWLPVLSTQVRTESKSSFKRRDT